MQPGIRTSSMTAALLSDFAYRVQTVGKGESRDPVRSAIVDKALTEQSPKRNYNN